MANIFSVLPAWLLLAIIVAISILLTLLAFKILRNIFSVEELEKFKDVTGVYVSMIGVLYGVFLAFIVIAIWENYDHVKDNIDKEADALGNMYRDAKGLPLAKKKSIDSCVSQYITLVVDREWATMSHNKEDKAAMDARAKLQDIIIKIKPRDLGEQVVFAQMLSNLNDLNVSRRMRVNTSNAELPGILWVILIGGAVLLIFYIASFYVPNQKFHLWLAFGVSTLVAILLFVAVELNYPFLGSEGLKPEAFQSLKHHNVQADSIKQNPIPINNDSH
jgi:hypothetical protein